MTVLSFDVHVNQEAYAEQAGAEVMQVLNASLYDDGLTENTDILDLRVRESLPESDSSFNNDESTSQEKGSGKTAAEKAMISLLSVAGASIVLVGIQRMVTKKQRGDEKSLDGSTDTPTTAHYTTTPISDETVSA